MKKTVSCILCLISICFWFSPAAHAIAAEEIFGYAQGIAAYKKTSLGLGPEDALFSESLLASAGSTAGDWYPFGMAALGIEDDYGAYLAALRENVRQRYRTEEKLSGNKATEWHRIILAALSCGADPTRFCTDDAGEPVDLVKDGVFMRQNITRQGLNGCIWALIALHTRAYIAPADAVNTEKTLLKTLYAKQLTDGGWAMTGDLADPDVTAMALIALAPLTKTDPAAAAAADAALACMSALQQPDGGFAESDIPNCESCAVTLTALCTLGVDPANDPRFLKNGRSVVDALLTYRLPDGSFTHAFIADADDPSAVPAEPNDMSCQQALYALAAYYRFLTDGTNIFDFSAREISDADWDVLPEPPGAAEAAAASIAERVKTFFADETHRRITVSAVLTVLIAAGLTALAVRRRRRKRQ